MGASRKNILGKYPLLGAKRGGLISEREQQRYIERLVESCIDNMNIDEQLGQLRIRIMGINDTTITSQPIGSSALSNHQKSFIPGLWATDKSLGATMHRVTIHYIRYELLRI